MAGFFRIGSNGGARGVVDKVVVDVAWVVSKVGLAVAVVVVAVVVVIFGVAIVVLGAVVGILGVGVVVLAVGVVILDLVVVVVVGLAVLFLKPMPSEVSNQPCKSEINFGLCHKVDRTTERVGRAEQCDQMFQAKSRPILATSCQRRRSLL